KPWLKSGSGAPGWPTSTATTAPKFAATKRPPWRPTLPPPYARWGHERNDDRGPGPAVAAALQAVAPGAQAARPEQGCGGPDSPRRPAREQQGADVRSLARRPEDLRPGRRIRGGPGDSAARLRT